MSERTPSGTETPSTPPRTDDQHVSAGEGPFDRFRRLDVRRSPDGWLGGVCAGLAHRVGLDPLVIRAGTVLLVIFFGLGLLLYLLAWACIPDQRERTHVEQGLRRGEGSSVFLLVITALVLLGSLPWWAGSAFGFDGGFGLVGLLITALLGWALWSMWKSRAAAGSVAAGYGQPATGTSATVASTGTATPPPPPPGATGTASDAAPGPMGPGGSAYGPGAPPPPPGTGAGTYPPTPPPVPPQPRRPRRRSGGLAATAVAVGLLMVILAGSQWAALGLGLPGNDLSVTLATSALVLGLLVLALGLAGRRAGFVGFLTGVSVLAALLAAPLPANLQWEGRGGEAVWAPRSAADLRDYRLGAGDAELDLTRIETTGLDRQDVEVGLGAGSLTLIVPEDLTVRVDSSIGAGELRLREAAGTSGGSEPRFSDGRTNDRTGGLGIQEQVELGQGTQPQLVVDASVGLGEIVIEQE